MQLNSTTRYVLKSDFLFPPSALDARGKPRKKRNRPASSGGYCTIVFYRVSIEFYCGIYRNTVRIFSWDWIACFVYKLIHITVGKSSCLFLLSFSWRLNLASSNMHLSKIQICLGQCKGRRLLTSYLYQYNRKSNCSSQFVIIKAIAANQSTYTQSRIRHVRKKIQQDFPFAPIIRLAYPSSNC